MGIPLDRINNVNFHQSILERRFGAGDLVIEAAGRDGQSRFTDVQHPEAVQLLIHEQTSRLNRQGTGTAGPPATSDLVAGASLA